MVDERKEADVTKHDDAVVRRRDATVVVTPKTPGDKPMLVRNPAPDASPPQVSPGTFGTFQVSR